MNVVFDTNVMISSTLFDNSLAKKLLVKLVENDIIIFYSNEIILEYLDVLKKDFHFDQEIYSTYLDEILSFANLVRVLERFKIIKEDPDDNKVLECALASNSEYIISYDKHLLKLKKFNNIKIISPVEAFKILK